MPTKIICVVGRGNTGKTTAIRTVLEKKGALRRTKAGDVKVIIEIKNKKQVYPIGITSSGDTLTAIKKNFKFLRHCRLKVIVCAARSRGNARREVERNAKRLKTKVQYINTKKVPPAQQRKEQQRIVRSILKMLP